MTDRPKSLFLMLRSKSMFNLIVKDFSSLFFYYFWIPGKVPLLWGELNSLKVKPSFCTGRSHNTSKKKKWKSTALKHFAYFVLVHMHIWISAFFPFHVFPNQHTGNTIKILLMINSCVVYACESVTDMQFLPEWVNLFTLWKLEVSSTRSGWVCRRTDNFLGTSKSKYVNIWRIEEPKLLWLPVK